MLASCKPPAGLSLSGSCASPPTRPGGSARPCRIIFCGTGQLSARARHHPRKACSSTCAACAPRSRARPGACLDDAGRQAIASELKVPKRDVDGMSVRLAASDQSLNAPVGEEGDLSWQDYLVDERPKPRSERNCHQRRRDAVRLGENRTLRAAKPGRTHYPRPVASRTTP